MSRVLAIHRYYWPDTPPYASMLRAIARAWTNAGHTVEVLAGQPSYKPETQLPRRPPVEQIDDTTVRRVAMRPDRSSAWRRSLNVLRFPVLVVLRVLLGRRYDVVMCSTVPPVLLGWVVSWAARRRGAEFVYHCMDLHPEIGRLSGEFSHPLVYRVLARLELATCRRAAAVVVLSEDMRDAVVARDPGLADRLVVLTNFELPDFDADPELSLPVPGTARLRLVFTGNLGRFQGLEPVIRALLQEAPRLDEVELVLMGEGAAKAQLQALVSAAPPERRNRVVFVPHGPPSAVRQLLVSADLGLVSLAPGVYRYAYPSKVATYLGEGLPLLIAVESDSALAHTVTDEGAGWALPTTDPTDLVDTLCDLVSRREELRAASDRALGLWRREYSAQELLPRWVHLLEDVLASRARHGMAEGAVP